jgi:N-acetylmuramoyl-L-alanine amidase
VNKLRRRNSNGCPDQGIKPRNEYGACEGRLDGRPFFVLQDPELRRSGSRFDMLLDVPRIYLKFSRRQIPVAFRRLSSRVFLGGMVVALSAPLSWQFAYCAHNAITLQEQVSATSATSGAPGNAAVRTSQSAPAPPQAPNNFPSNIQSNVLNTVVLDPAHGGTDPGARGTGGIRESEVVLEFAMQIRRALESQGLQVVQTRLGDENPSFDDRSTMANAQRGAVFITIHISSTGLPGTARVYVNSDLPQLSNTTGLIPWDQAQAPFLGLSRKLGDTVQSLLAQRFKGSPNASQTAAVRQLRTTAAPAIAVEISSVTVEKREDLDRMAPGVADAIARGVAAFKPSYVVPATATPAQTLPAASAGTPARTMPTLSSAPQLAGPFALPSAITSAAPFGVTHGVLR